MAPIDHVTTSGTFNLDGGSFDVDNNVWIVGNDSEVFVIDAAHDADAIAKAVGDRRVKDRQVRREVLLRPARIVAAPVVFGNVGAAGDLPGEEPPPERAVGHEADADLLAGG